MLRRTEFLDSHEYSGPFARNSLWDSSPDSIGKNVPRPRASHFPDIPVWLGQIFRRSRSFMGKRSAFNRHAILNLEWESRQCSVGRDYRLRSEIFFALTMFTHRLWLTILANGSRLPTFLIGYQV